MDTSIDENDEIIRWDRAELELALGPDLEERTRIERKEVFWRARKRGTLKSVENWAAIIRGEEKYTSESTLIRFQDDEDLQLRISEGGSGRKEIFGFGGLSNIAASPGSSALLTPEAEEMKRLSMGGENAKKKGFFARIFGR